MKIEGGVPLLGGGDLKMGEKGARLGELHMAMTAGPSAGAAGVVLARGGDGCACETGLAGGGIFRGVFVKVVGRIFGA